MSRSARSRRTRRQITRKKDPAVDVDPLDGYYLFDCGGDLHYAVGFTLGRAPYGMPVAALEGDFDQPYDYGQAEDPDEPFEPRLRRSGALEHNPRRLLALADARAAAADSRSTETQS